MGRPTVFEPYISTKMQSATSFQRKCLPDSDCDNEGSITAPVKSLPDEASVYGSHMNSDPGPGIYAFKGKAGNEEPRSDPSFETDNAYTTLILPCPVMIIPINLRTPPYYY
ncbi:unnamed protein product [Cuscuta epithymum]|uniref:Uncharacterized protein n=1 Tax=Cuscuta epithymum TaxID=186058 RepID=A0AAV0FK06_9ASTE|nr:unnamed protein product [Cuscuta epithymum]